MGSRWGEPARSQALLRASIALMAARRRVPSVAGPPMGNCEGVRPAAFGRRDRDGLCLFRVGQRLSGARSHRREADLQVVRPGTRRSRWAVDDPERTFAIPNSSPSSRRSERSDAPDGANRGAFVEISPTVPAASSRCRWSDIEPLAPQPNVFHSAHRSPKAGASTFALRSPAAWPDLIRTPEVMLTCRRVSTDMWRAVVELPWTIG